MTTACYSTIVDSSTLSQLFLPWNRRERNETSFSIQPPFPLRFPFSPRDSPRVHFPSFHRATMERVERGGRWRSLKRGETLFPPFPSAGNELLLWVDERGNKTIHPLPTPSSPSHFLSLSLRNNNFSYVNESRSFFVREGIFLHFWTSEKRVLDSGTMR